MSKKGILWNWVIDVIGRGGKMDINQIIVTIVSAIVSGVLATAITLFINYKQQIRRQKLDLLADLFGYRFQISNGSHDKKDFLKAINRVPIVFQGCDDVIKCYDEFYEARATNMGANIANDKLVSLLKVMCKDAGIKCDNWNDTMISRVFS